MPSLFTLFTCLGWLILLSCDTIVSQTLPNSPLPAAAPVAAAAPAPAPPSSLPSSLNVTTPHPSRFSIAHQFLHCLGQTHLEKGNLSFLDTFFLDTQHSIEHVTTLQLFQLDSKVFGYSNEWVQLHHDRMWKRLNMCRKRIKKRQRLRMSSSSSSIGDGNGNGNKNSTIPRKHKKKGGKVKPERNGSSHPMGLQNTTTTTSNTTTTSSGIDPLSKSPDQFKNGSDKNSTSQQQPSNPIKPQNNSSQVVPKKNDNPLPPSPPPPHSNVTLLPPAKCEKINKRKAYHTLSDEEKKAFTKAFLKLVTVDSPIPSKLSPGRTINLWEYLVEFHAMFLHEVHGSPLFLHFHRLFMAEFERLLQEHGGFQGGIPYWEWTIDANKMLESSVFNNNPDFGFGGNGNQLDPLCYNKGYKITDGAFSNLTFWYSNQPYTVCRQFNDNQDQLKLTDRKDLFGFHVETYLSKTFENNFLQVHQDSSFYSFASTLENVIHSCLHSSIGGNMRRLRQSSMDVLFYLVHTKVDQIVFKWQELGKNQYKLDGALKNGEVLSKDYVFKLDGYVGNVPIKELYDTRGGGFNGRMCYEYA